MGRRILHWLVGAGALLPAGCETFDGAIFDERLRRATFDAYVDTIEAQFGGLGAAGVSGDDLRARYRAAAVDADTPAAFYGILRALLSDLDDPHAGLTVSPRFWVGPVAEPEWIQFVEYEGLVHAGLPRPSVRGFEEAVAARAGWLKDCGASDVSDLSQATAAAFLRASAAFGPGHPGGERARLRITKFGANFMKLRIVLRIDRPTGRIPSIPFQISYLKIDFSKFVLRTGPHH